MASIQTENITNPPFPATVNGAMRWHRSPEVSGISGEAARTMIFANGMNNTPDAAMTDALLLSGVIQGRILHVYNQAGDLIIPTTTQMDLLLLNAPFLAGLSIAGPTPPPPPSTGNPLVDRAARRAWELLVAAGGAVTAARTIFRAAFRVLQFGNDLVQCTIDWANVLIALKGDAVLAPLFSAHPALCRQLMELYLSANPPIRSLFLFLDDNAWNASDLAITAHSQGNLIVSAAMHALKVVRSGTFPPRATTVFSVASPATNFPAGISLRYYTNSNDLVPYLSLGRSFVDLYGAPASVGKGSQNFPGSHAVSEHLRSTALQRDLRIHFGLESAAVSLDIRQRIAMKA